MKGTGLVGGGGGAGKTRTSNAMGVQLALVRRAERLGCGVDFVLFFLFGVRVEGLRHPARQVAIRRMRNVHVSLW